MTSLAETLSQVVSAAGINLSLKGLPEHENRINLLKIAVGEWESGNSLLPPTWKSLLDILENLHLEDLSQLIKTYFGEILNFR